MNSRKRVLVYGKTLNLAGVTASLKLDGCLDVMFVNPQGPNARQCLEEFNPETIIFDLTDTPADLDIKLLRKRPGLLLIGVDPSSNEVLALTGKRNRVVTASELAQLVSEHQVPAPTGDELIEQGEGGTFETAP